MPNSIKKRLFTAPTDLQDSELAAYVNTKRQKPWDQSRWQLIFWVAVENTLLDTIKALHACNHINRLKILNDILYSKNPQIQKVKNLLNEFGYFDAGKSFEDSGPYWRDAWFSDKLLLLLSFNKYDKEMLEELATEAIECSFFTSLNGLFSYHSEFSNATYAKALVHLAETWHLKAVCDPRTGHLKPIELQDNVFNKAAMKLNAFDSLLEKLGTVYCLPREYMDALMKNSFSMDPSMQEIMLKLAINNNFDDIVAEILISPQFHVKNIKNIDGAMKTAITLDYFKVVAHLLIDGRITFTFEGDFLDKQKDTNKSANLMKLYVLNSFWGGSYKAQIEAELEKLVDSDAKKMEGSEDIQA